MENTRVNAIQVSQHCQFFQSRWFVWLLAPLMLLQSNLAFSRAHHTKAKPASKIHTSSHHSKKAAVHDRHALKHKTHSKTKNHASRKVHEKPTESLAKKLSNQNLTLKEKIDFLLRDSGLSEHQMSIQIAQIAQTAPLPQSNVVYEKNPNLTLNPASNTKLLTEAVALQELGPNFTFKTEFYSDNQKVDGTGAIHDLWIKGYGDPVLDEEEVETIAQGLFVSGLRKITGNVFVDDSYFDRYDSMTYLSRKNEKIYEITTGPLSFNFNKKSAIVDPSLYTGFEILKALQQKGVVLNISATDVRREATPHQTFLLATHDSPPLREILKGLCKHSNNFIAEQLIKTISAHHFGPPGTTAKGISLLQDYLESLGIPKKVFTLDNGSGLSQKTRLSSAQMMQVLTDLYESSWQDDVISSLSIAGIDGTIRKRLRSPEMKGKIFAKTGTLDNVSALSGYFLDQKRQFAFSFLFNDVHCPHNQLARLEEDILQTVASSLK